MAVRYDTLLTTQVSGVIFFLFWSVPVDKLTSCYYLSFRPLLKYWLLLQSGRLDLPTCLLTQFGSFLAFIAISWAHRKISVTL